MVVLQKQNGAAVDRKTILIQLYFIDVSIHCCLIVEMKEEEGEY